MGRGGHGSFLSRAAPPGAGRGNRDREQVHGVTRERVQRHAGGESAVIAGGGARHMVIGRIVAGGPAVSIGTASTEPRQGHTTRADKTRKRECPLLWRL